MGSVSLGIMQARTAVERVVAIEDVGKAIVRWGGGTGTRVDWRHEIHSVRSYGHSATRSP